jgi:hypothetical protein
MPASCLAQVPSSQSSSSAGRCRHMPSFGWSAFSAFHSQYRLCRLQLCEVWQCWQVSGLQWRPVMPSTSSSSVLSRRLTGGSLSVVGTSSPSRAQQQFILLAAIRRSCSAPVAPLPRAPAGRRLSDSGAAGSCAGVPAAQAPSSCRHRATQSKSDGMRRK